MRVLPPQESQSFSSADDVSERMREALAQLAIQNEKIKFMAENKCVFPSFPDPFLFMVKNRAHCQAFFSFTPFYSYGCPSDNTKSRKQELTDALGSFTLTSSII
jgi:hypothetical protein